MEFIQPVQEVRKNINNHLFIIHGIINSVLKGEHKCIDIQIYDLVKAFDVLWLADSMNSLWDTLPSEARDDKLGLVYETSKTWGPMLCSNSIDTVGKYCLENGQLFLYKKNSRDNATGNG